MKNSRILFIGLFTLWFFTSCDKQDLSLESSGLGELTIAEVEVGDLKATEAVDEEVNAARYAAHLRGLYEPFFVVPRWYLGRHFPECATVTVDRDSFPKTITIDYGDSCVDKRGHTKSGIVVITLSDSLHIPGATYTVTYTDLTMGEKVMNLDASYTFEGYNEDGNAVMSWNAVSTTVIGDTVTIGRDVSHSKTWLSGYDTPEIEDDIFQVEGGGTVTVNDEYEFTREIIEPLMVDRSCRFIISGIIEITRNDESLQIDFGDGECDNIAVVTKDGETEEIELISERFRNDFGRKHKNMRREKGWW